MNKPGQYKWHSILLVLILLYWMLPSGVIEKYYSTGIYSFIHGGLNLVFSRLPFPGFYIVLIALFILSLKWLMILVSKDSIGRKLARITGNIAKWVSWYFILWGFNYARIPLDEKLNLNIRPLTKSELLSEIATVSNELFLFRRQMEKDTVPVNDIYFQYQTSANDKLAYVLGQWNYKAMQVKNRELYDDILLRFDVGGQYMPYTGEANIDAGIHYYNKPYYMIHEMCHANGFCDEASCNFISYVACTVFNEPGFQYSAGINYFRYLLGDLRDMDSMMYQVVREELPALLIYDLELLKRHAEQHTYKTAIIGEAINNAYLKLMGIPEGTQSYNKMVLLVYAWRNRQVKKLSGKSAAPF